MSKGSQPGSMPGSLTSHLTVANSFTYTMPIHTHSTDAVHYKVLYTHGHSSPRAGFICAVDYVTANSITDAWTLGEARAQGRERVADVIPCN